MRPVALCLFLVPLCQAATRNVTVLVNFEKPHSAVSVQALKQQLKKLLEPAGIAVDVMLKNEMPVSPQFAELVVFEMKGSCSMSATPLTENEISEERGPLGLAYESDGEILHFGEILCDRVRHCLQRVTHGANPAQHQAEYGAALGIVLAHEIYHMIAGVKAHTKDGLTKESLSAYELLDGHLSIPEAVRTALLRDIMLGTR
jgi:hypothetical protein